MSITLSNPGLKKTRKMLAPSFSTTRLQPFVGHVLDEDDAIDGFAMCEKPNAQKARFLSRTISASRAFGSEKF
jgi:hypothetical protein